MAILRFWIYNNQDSDKLSVNYRIKPNLIIKNGV